MKQNPRTLQFFSLVVAGLALLAGLFRFLYARGNDRALFAHPILDADVYFRWASELASGGGSATGPFYQSPGYPYVLAAVFKLTGPTPVPALVLQSVLGIATIVVTAFLGRKLFGNRVGIIAAVLLLFLGPLYFFESKLLATSVAVFLVSLAVYSAVSAEDAWEERRKRPGIRFFAAGVIAGALALFRANLLLFAVILAAVYLLRALRRRISWKHPLLFGAGVLLTLLPSSIHNISRGAVAPVATSGGFNFYLGNFQGATGVYGDVPGTSGSIRTQEAEADSMVLAHTGRLLTPGMESRYWFRRGVEEIGRDPGRWLKLIFRKIRLSVNRVEETINGSYALETSRNGMLRALLLPFNLLSVLGLAGLGVSWTRYRRKGGWSPAAPSALVLAVFLSVTLFFVLSRLRLPASPILAIYAAFALDAFRQWWRTGNRARTVFAVVGVVVFTALTWRSPLGEPRNPVWEAKLFVEVGRGLESTKPDEARRAYTEALDLDPSSLDALLCRGELFVQQRNLESAIGDLEAARELSPGHRSLRSNLGILYFLAGRDQECLSEMDAAARLSPDEATPDLYRGFVLKRVNRPVEAAVFLEAAIRKNSGLSTAYAPLLEIYLAGDRVAEARLLVQRAEAAGIPIPPALLVRLP